MTIPAIIHYCWFGKRGIPPEHQAYIEGWRQLHPEYTFMFWNDDTFARYLENHDSEFVLECQKRNLPGFLSDFVRLTVLYEYGGIYLDTDVEVFRSLDGLREADLFLGYIFDSLIGTAIIGAQRGNPLIGAMLERLESDFRKTHSLTVSNNWVTAFLLENCSDLLLCGKRQTLSQGIEIYPKDYFERFCVEPGSGGGFSEHHCYGSWYNRKQSPLKNLLKSLVGRRLISTLGHWRANRRTPFYERYEQDLRAWKARERPGTSE